MQPPDRLHPISRRRLLALAGGSAAALSLPPGLLAAQAPPAAPPPDFPAADLPLPSTLAADASPAFRAVAEMLMAALLKSHIPGAALGILVEGREEHAVFGL